MPENGRTAIALVGFLHYIFYSCYRAILLAYSLVDV
jgi:hypothetical protein